MRIPSPTVASLHHTVHLLGAFIPLVAMAQIPPTITWQRAIGGTETDQGFAVGPGQDGGFYTAGWTRSSDGDAPGTAGAEDAWFIKLSSQGALDWQQVYGGSMPDGAVSVVASSGGGYVLAGFTDSNDGDVSGAHGSRDFWVWEIDVQGNLLWQTTYGGSGFDQANSLASTADGGFILTGSTTSADGDVTGQHGGADVWVLKLDAQGAVQWQRTIGGSQDDSGSNVLQTADLGFVVVGRSRSSNGDLSTDPAINNDVLVVKLAPDGSTEWLRTWGSMAHDSGIDIAERPGGGYWVLGEANQNSGDVTGNHGESDAWLLQVDATGALIQQRSLGGSWFDNAHSLTLTADGGCIMANRPGSTDGDLSMPDVTGGYWITKVDALGEITWMARYGGNGIGPDMASAIMVVPGGGYLITGWSASTDGDVTGNHGGSADIWVIRIDDDSTVELPTHADAAPFGLFPNPLGSDEHLTIRSSSPGSNVVFLDQLGRLVHAVTLRQCSELVDLTRMAPGMYHVRLTNVTSTSSATLIVP